MRSLYLAVLVIFSGVCLNAQDIHFSQYYTSPLTLNPALTGDINGDFRATLNYRNQWFTIPTLNSIAPYQTYQASFDAPLLRDRLGNDGFGIGGMFYSDKAGDGALTTFSGMVSIAYHKAVDRYGRAHVSLGLQAGVVSEQLNINNLIFENQLDGFGWNTNLPNGENYTSKALIYPDVNIGALWTHMPKDYLRYYIGFSMDHLSRPYVSFLANDGSNRLDYRFNVNGGMDIFLNSDQSFSLSPTFLFMLQGQAQEYDLGLGANDYLNDNFAIFGGLLYRVGDAIIPTAGVEVYNARIGLSYDVNYSDLKTATNAQGALELSVVYIFKNQRPGKIQYAKYCPLF